jgi:hypothetical protein
MRIDTPLRNRANSTNREKQSSIWEVGLDLTFSLLRRRLELVDVLLALT